ncbi:MAG: DUF1223 domain-containing protein [Labilithrix sp.]|nr:DUF1223 domain-containing protein [Labilithrix sp.]MCW5810372.1 DUF1223 domain-containing protein [Labilithrix sp.]
MRRLAWAMGGVLVVGGALAGAACLLAPQAEAAPPGPHVSPAPGTTPILVELFTSEGCSSCPPADAVAARLVSAQPVAGAHVIVLAHHVDYWDRLGWPDPWSSAGATARQRSYAPLKSGSYTPQVVVDGRSEMVGSRASAIEQAIASAAKEPHVRVELVVVAVANEKDTFDVTVTTPALPAGAELLVAVVQDRGRVAVPRGENAGQTLDHAAIARSLVTIGATTKTRVKVPAAIEAPQGTGFSVVAFAQDRASRHVLGVATAPLVGAR